MISIIPHAMAPNNLAILDQELATHPPQGTAFVALVFHVFGQVAYLLDDILGDTILSALPVLWPSTHVEGPRHAEQAM
jgi:hypothetical protein